MPESYIWFWPRAVSAVGGAPFHVRSPCREKITAPWTVSEWEGENCEARTRRKSGVSMVMVGISRNEGKYVYLILHTRKFPDSCRVSQYDQIPKTTFRFRIIGAIRSPDTAEKHLTEDFYYPDRRRLLAGKLPSRLGRFL